MEHVWSVLCSKAIIDQRTRMLSLIDALDAIESSDQFPAANPENPVNIGPLSIQVVSFWYRSNIEEPETGKYRVKLIGPNGRSYGPPQHEVEINLVGGSAHNSIVEVPQFPYVGLGIYYFEIEKKGQSETSWSRVARLPLQVKMKTG